MDPYKLEFQAMYDEIVSVMPEAPLKNEVLLALNKALRRMNSKMTPEKKIITLSGSEGATSIGDMTTTKISGLTDYKIGEYTRFGSEFSYDADEYALKIDHSITRVIAVYLDDVPWEHYDYETVKDTANATAYIYHFDGRYIYFPKDIEASAEVIKLQVEMYFPDIEEGFILVPYTYRSMLVDGATYFLMMQPKYRDSDQYKTYFKEIKKNFYDQIEEMEMKNFELQPLQYTPKKYYYGEYNKTDED